MTKLKDHTCYLNLPSCSDCWNRGLPNTNSVKASSVDASIGVLSIYTKEEVNYKLDFKVVSIFFHKQW